MNPSISIRALITGFKNEFSGIGMILDIISIKKSMAIMAAVTTTGEDDNMLDILWVRIYQTSRRVDTMRIKMIKSMESVLIGVALSQAEF